MFANNIAQETRKHPRAANNLTKQSASIGVELAAHSIRARRAHRTARASEIIARVRSEMDKPRLTKSVRNALEAEDALAGYCRIA